MNQSRQPPPPWLLKQANPNPASTPAEPSNVYDLGKGWKVQGTNLSAAPSLLQGAWKNYIVPSLAARGYKPRPPVMNRGPLLTQGNYDWNTLGMGTGSMLDPYGALGGNLNYLGTTQGINPFAQHMAYTQGAAGIPMPGL